MTGAIVATSIIFFPAAPLFLFMKGKDIEIPQGHEVTVYTNTDYKVINSTGVVSAFAAPPATKLTGTALTNADVIALKAADMADQVVIDKIHSSPANFKLETADLVELKKAAISDAVISAMLETARR
jgi:hypothetical protein